MKTRQSKKGEYHTIAVRFPTELWEEVKAKDDTEHKSYSAFVVETVRHALKDKTQ